MAIYPFLPVPASVHMPQYLDPSLRFESDQGVSIRRARTRRPRRIFQLDYLGLTSQEMRHIRGFLLDHRLSVTPFSFYNLNAIDTVTLDNTTPVTISNYQHPFLTGQWLILANTAGGALDGAWQVTKLSYNSLSLIGTTAVGTITGTVAPYLPTAIGHFPEDHLESATKLIGPDSTDSTRGRFSQTVFIEEIL